MEQKCINILPDLWQTLLHAQIVDGWCLLSAAALLLAVSSYLTRVVLHMRDKEVRGFLLPAIWGVMGVLSLIALWIGIHLLLVPEYAAMKELRRDWDIYMCEGK